MSRPSPGVLLVMLASNSGSKKHGASLASNASSVSPGFMGRRAPSFAAALTAAANAAGSQRSTNFRAVWPLCGPLFSQNSFA